jgi:hypothetical protein
MAATLVASPDPGHELVVFETDPAGRVRRARFGGNYTDRIETWEDR